MIQTGEKIKQNDIYIYALSFRIAHQEKLFCGCGKVPQIPFVDCIWSILKGRSRKTEGYRYAIL
jgi:hypothetical protein